MTRSSRNGRGICGPTEGGGPVLKCSAAAGFRSTLLNLPRRVLFAGCAAIYGVLLKTLAEIAENDCPVDAHLPGGTVGLIDPATGQVFASCSRASRAVCTQHIGHDRYFLASETIVESIYNGQTKGPALLATSKGNETNLKDPLPVIIGERVARAREPVAYSKQFNNNHPEQGFVRAVFPISEGPIAAMTRCAVNDTLIGFEHLNVRLGERGQSPTSFSPNVPNMSGTAHFFGVYGQVNPAGYNASNLKGQANVLGLSNIRVYSDPVTFVKTYTNNRGWGLFEMECNTRWGRAKKRSGYVIQEWIDLANWSDEIVTYRTADGEVHTSKRSSLNVELLGRPTNDQIADVCLFGRYTKPFRHNGYTRVLPLRKEVIDDSILVFTDQGRDANIVPCPDGDSQLFYSYKSDADLCNEIVMTFEDANHQNVARPLTFSDQPAQKKAAEALGDTAGVHVVSKPYSALGITNEGEAIRVGWMLLHLGEFDEGGLANNFRAHFITPFHEALNLYKSKLIRVVSPKIEDFGFEYFRVVERRRRSDLQVEVIAQAYPVDFYEQWENAEQPPPLDGSVALGNPGGRSSDLPEAIGFATLSHTSDRIYGRLQPSTFLE